MESLAVTANDYDFRAVHAALRRYVDANILAGVSSAVLVGRELVDLNCVGWADKEQDAGSLTLVPSPLDPKGATGEIQWGGIAGTHWWRSPKANLAGLLMTQRQMAFWHPFSFEFKQLVYQAVSRTRDANPT